MVVWRIAACLSVFWLGCAWGQIYKWTDRQGNMHLTDNASRIPSEFRSQVEVERSSPSPPLPASDDAAKAPTTDATVPSESPAKAPARDLLGRGPDYWQQLAREWSDRLQQHVDERDRLQLLYNYTLHVASYTRDVFDRGRVQADITRLEKAIAEVDEQIKAAEAMLWTTLPLEARRLGANPDWLKPPGMMQ
jgi:predicted Zn-dependent peptidase